MHSVRHLLQEKGTDIWSVRPSATIFEALQLMAEKNIGAVLVAEDDRLLGIFSERDYARKVILYGRSSKDTEVRDLMTSHIYHVAPDASVQECMSLMTKHKIRHLPVLDDGTLVGIITIGDVVKHIISQQADHIRGLETYISGGYA